MLPTEGKDETQHQNQLRPSFQTHIRPVHVHKLDRYAPTFNDICSIMLRIIPGLFGSNHATSRLSIRTNIEVLFRRSYPSRS